jgi:uncharacterized protein
VAGFVRDDDVLVCVSLDGRARRTTATDDIGGGKPTSDRVVAGLDPRRRHDCDWNVLTTIEAANRDHALEVDRFRRDEVRDAHVQRIPLVHRVRLEVAERAASTCPSSGCGRRTPSRVR